MTKSFIETQFPIARLSAESYKERKAVAGQTLTGLGKWWGRKPLILVRASILGMLMPASSDPKRDREIFLKILTMDDAGVWNRCVGDIPVAEWRDAAPADIQEEFFGSRGFIQGISDEEKDEIRERIWGSLSTKEQIALDAKKRRPIPDPEEFDALPYAERIQYCDRPENISGPTLATWVEINAHLGTTAFSLSALVEQLGQRRFGHRPRVGDSFCGGGSIPFEAARIGCEAYGSDLNPVAALLTWASLNLLGGGRAVQEEAQRIQQRVFAAADSQITEWRIEHNEDGERADAYLYCVEVKPEGCDYYIPLSPSWVVADKTRVVVDWHRPPGADRLHPQVHSVPATEFNKYKSGKGATAVNGRVVDPLNPDRSWSLESLRGPEGLRRWTNDDVAPRLEDVFQERLYCIRWVKKVRKNGKLKDVRRYAAPDDSDHRREVRALELLRTRFTDWQLAGFIPSSTIKPGSETDRLARERGWTCWHHLFTPRQLLSHGVIAELAGSVEASIESHAFCLLTIARIANWNSRLCRWLQPQGGGIGGGVETFYNQAFNSLANYSVRPISMLKSALPNIRGEEQFSDPGQVDLIDARDVDKFCDLWITDPPYGDAVSYHELADFFLAWYDKRLGKAFPQWLPDSRAELAVRGEGDDFRRSMVDVYTNLARHMPDNGLQMVMFTHQNPAVWADLGMILWAAGLTSTAAWTISTETAIGGMKKGNYVSGTVCMVLRKRVGDEAGFLDEIFPMVEDEVHRQIDSMRALDEDGEPNFNDADYQLAAYAAALKVLTKYDAIDGRDVEHEVFAVRPRNEVSDFQAVIERAIGIACDYLVPRGLDVVWRDLSLAERYYLRALDIESRGERRKGMYEELARGFNLTDIKPLLLSDKANGARMLTPSAFAASTLATSDDGQNEGSLPTRRGRAAASGPHPFATSPLRHLLFAIRETARNDRSPEPGRQYLRDTFGQAYWGKRERFVHLLDWLAALGNALGMDEWVEDSESARILAGRLRNDHA